VALADDVLPAVSDARPEAAGPSSGVPEGSMPDGTEPSDLITIPAASQRVRVYVWQVPVRVTHWVIFASVMVLTVTGAYIADPFLVPMEGSVMSTMRFWHMLAAWVFLAAGLARTYWLFAGNRFARWRAFFPVTRAQLREVAAQTGWYLFLRRDAPKVLGHNQLAAGAYLIVFFLFFIQTITGFALAGVDGSEPWASLFGWVPAVFLGIQNVRLVHHLVMWAIIGFMIHHVYSALLVEHWEKNGLMSSIFTGYKFITRGEIAEARDGGVDVERVAE
jgi:Ni/Fe-hydrogenase 1 B-type cytochrome subunit